ncbi:MAG: hypothetical protein ACOX4N_00030 [Dethiobacteraceae bacterium]|jgi:hypothetical protein
MSSKPAKKIIDFKFKLDEALKDYMIKQLDKTRFNPRELRLSENGSCPRKRVLRALGYSITHPMTLEDAKNFEKGRAIELWVTNILEQLYPGEIIREFVVNHPYGDPIGEGHVDIVWPSKKLLVEIKAVSEERANQGLPIQDHVDQLMGYLHFKKDPDGKRYYTQGKIIYLIIGRYGITPVEYPVFYVPEKGEALEAEMRDLWVNHVLQEIVPFVPKDAHAKGFPCYWESTDLKGNTCPHYCEFHGHCWTEDSFLDDICTELDDNKELFAEYHRVRETMKALDSENKKLRAQKGVLEARLSRLYEKLGEKKLIAGDIQISRAVIKGRVSYDIKSALECGAVDMEAIKPFMSQSPGYERFTVRKVKQD